jgi:uncharacterized membrane protein YbhN (UPF0104 family)
MKKIGSRLKPFLRWMILGATLFFLAQALKNHWQEVIAIRIHREGWVFLSMALGVTLLAHTWCGWVWGWILQEFNQPVKTLWAIRVFLKTNIAKYLPGNVWHFYGRVWAARKAGISLEAAILSVVLEPLLMAASALLIALIGSTSQWWGLQVLSLAVVAIGIHPRVLNPVIQYLSRLKAKAIGGDTIDTAVFQVKRYPLRPWLGELGFLGLRSAGFLLTVLALGSVSLNQIPILLSAFSLAWLLGLVVPGAPGGMGVFEATALALLNHRFSTGLILSAVALYRLVSILAEAAGAGIAWLEERRQS